MFHLRFYIQKCESWRFKKKTKHFRIRFLLFFFLKIHRGLKFNNEVENYVFGLRFEMKEAHCEI